DPIGASESKGDDYDPGERWSPDRGGLKEDLIERHCCGQLLSRDEARGQGAAGGTVQRGERRAQRSEGVEVRDACEAELRPDRERDRARREADLRGNEQAAAIDAVCDHAAEERKGDEWDRLEEADETHVERRSREEEDLVRNGHETELSAGERHELAGPEQPERAGLAERREIDQRRCLTKRSVASSHAKSSRVVGLPSRTPVISWTVDTTRRVFGGGARRCRRHPRRSFAAGRFWAARRALPASPCSCRRAEVLP